MGRSKTRMWCVNTSTAVQQSCRTHLFLAVAAHHILLVPVACCTRGNMGTTVLPQVSNGGRNFSDLHKLSLSRAWLSEGGGGCPKGCLTKTLTIPLTKPLFTNSTSNPLTKPLTNPSLNLSPPTKPVGFAQTLLEAALVCVGRKGLAVCPKGCRYVAEDGERLYGTPTERSCVSEGWG